MPQPSPYFTPNNSDFAAPGGMAAIIAGQNRNDVDLAEAAGNNFAKFAGMMTDFSDKQKQIKANGTAAKTFFKNNPDALSAAGLHPDEVDNLDNETAASALTGVFKKQGYDQAQEEMKSTVAQMANYGAQAQLRQQQALDDKVSGAITTATMADPDFAKDPKGALQRAAAAAAASGAPTDAISRTFPRVIDAISKMATVGADIDNTPQWGTGPDGEQYLYQPKTKNPPIISPFTKSDARITEIDAREAATANKGLLPPGSKLSQDASGVIVATTPTGFMKIIGKPAKGSNLNDFVKAFGGTTNDAPATPSPAPAAPTPLKIVVQGGNRFQINADGTSTLLGPAK